MSLSNTVLALILIALLVACILLHSQMIELKDKVEQREKDDRYRCDLQNKYNQAMLVNMNKICERIELMEDPKWLK